MNKTFKVARSLTRGTVVTSEKASSYQGKAVKTVIAAAVASLVAGAAMAATTPTATVAPTVTIEGTLAVTAKDSANVYTPTDKVTVTEDDGKTTHAWDGKDAVKDVLSDVTGNSAVVLAGGTISVTDTTETVKSLEVQESGKIVVTASKGAAGLTINADSVDAANTYKSLDLSLSVLNGKDQGYGATVSLKDTNAHTFETGTLSTVAAGTGASHGKAQLTSDGDLIFGQATTYTKKPTEGGTGNGAVDKEGTAYNFDIQADTEVSGSNVTLNKGNVKVAAGSTLTINAATGDKKVEVLKEVTFANAGLVKVSGPTVNFNTVYDTADNAGQLELAGTTAVNVGGTIKGGELQIGAFATTADKKDTANVAFAGETNKVTGTVDVDVLSFNKDDGKPLTVTGEKASLKTGATNVSVAGADLTVSNKATASLGALTIKDATAAADLTLTVDANATAKADSLTINAAQTNVAGQTNTQAGSFTLASGAFAVGTLTNNGTISLGQATSKLSIVAAGESKNAGTISGIGSYLDYGYKNPA